MHIAAVNAGIDVIKVKLFISSLGRETYLPDNYYGRQFNDICNIYYVFTLIPVDINYIIIYKLLFGFALWCFTWMIILALVLVTS